MLVAGWVRRLSADRRRLAALVASLALPAGLLLTAAGPAQAASYEVTATIAVGRYPQGVGVDPSTGTVYVTNGADGGTVSVIDEATNSVTATINTGGDPYGVGVDPSTDTVYVVNDNVANGYGYVSVIDGATNTVTATINTGPESYPVWVWVDPATDTVYAANQGNGVGSSVSVIDGATNTVTATIGVDNYPEGVGVDPSTDTIYVSNFLDGTVSVIDGGTNTVTGTIAVGSNPEGVGVDPSTGTVYVANEAANTVSVIDAATGTVTGTIYVGGSGSDPYGVGVDPSTNTVYVTNLVGGTVSVIDGATNTVTATIGVGAEPLGLGVDPSTHTAYVANYGADGTVSVIAPQFSDTDLAIARPASITADATGPSGAIVTYPAPAVTDGDDTSPPAASCTLASGTVFAIGTTTVNCTATDPDDSNSPVSTSFTVTVRGAAAQLADLSQAVHGVGPGNSLAAKVQQAQTDLAAGNVAGACGTLGALINAVSAQSGKSIPAGHAAQLIADAQRIRSVLAC